MKLKELETIEEVIQLTQQELRAHAEYETSLNSWNYTYISALFALLLLLVLLFHSWPILSVLLSVMPIAGFGIMCLMYWQSNLLKKRILRTHEEIGKMLRFLIKHGDLRVLNVLIEALTAGKVTYIKLFFRDWELRESIADKIAFLLDQVDDRNVNMLDAETRRRLSSLLASPDPNETFLYVAILKALVYLGNRDTERVIEQLIDEKFDPERIRALETQLRLPGGAYGVEKHQLCYLRLKEVAEECLPRLRERLQREASGALLLRAADPLQAGPGELLLPAADTTESNPKQLLRVASDHAPTPKENLSERL